MTRLAGDARAAIRKLAAAIKGDPERLLEQRQ